MSILKSRWGVATGLLLIHRLACADAGYSETVQITGGSLVESLRSIPFMPKSFKQLLEPTTSSKWVHGNRQLPDRRVPPDLRRSSANCCRESTVRNSG